MLWKLLKIWKENKKNIYFIKKIYLVKVNGIVVNDVLYVFFFLKCVTITYKDGDKSD